MLTHRKDFWVCVQWEGSVNPTHTPSGCWDIPLWLDVKQRQASFSQFLQRDTSVSLVVPIQLFFLPECPTALERTNKIGHWENENTQSIFISLSPASNACNFNSELMKQKHIWLYYFKWHTLSLKTKEKMFGRMLPCYCLTCQNFLDKNPFICSFISFLLVRFLWRDSYGSTSGLMNKH